MRKIFAISFVSAVVTGAIGAGNAMANPLTCSACGLFHVPELDLNSAAAALAVLAGGIALVVERYRRRNSPKAE